MTSLKANAVCSGSSAFSSAEVTAIPLTPALRTSSALLRFMPPAANIGRVVWNFAALIVSMGTISH